MLVCIDMGHAMNTPGKCTPPYEDGTIIKEAVQNYAVGFRLAELLSFNGISYVYTTKDIKNDLKLSERVKKEKNSGADILVSIHMNASPKYEWNDITGIETYCYKFGYNAEKLATFIQKRLIELTGSVNRGIKEGNFQMLRETKAPAALVELNFMTNYEDAEKMTDKKTIDLYAKGICMGICDYFGIPYIENSRKDEIYSLIRQNEQNLERIKELL